jgi:hypothetical protein
LEKSWRGKKEGEQKQKRKSLLHKTSCARFSSTELTEKGRKKSLMYREQQKKRGVLFFFFPRVCLAGRSFMVNKGEWWLVLVWRQKEGLCFGLESGSRFCSFWRSFGAAPPVGGGALLIFSCPSIGFPNLAAADYVALHVFLPIWYLYLICRLLSTVKI